MSIQPRLLVYSSLFPSPADPTAGVFIRERMFRVARELPLVVVSPKAWFPGEGLIRLFRPRFRPVAPRVEIQHGIHVHAPRFLSIPGLFKSLDSLFMALGTYATLRRLRREFEFNVIDAHFGYPDGHAASLLGRWLGVPVSITLRGSERTYVEQATFRRRISAALLAAKRVFAVSQSLRQLAINLGTAENKAIAIGNAVDSERFQPVNREAARQRLGIAQDDIVLITVGWLVERKGFHRVIACLPELITKFPRLLYLVVGGASAAGSMEEELRNQVDRLGLSEHVRFLGMMPAEELKWPLSASDVFALSTRREGWANVLLEAMACGLPVVTTDVDGNPEVVCKPELGTLVPFGDHAALCAALDNAVDRNWNRQAIRAYAVEHSWDNRVQLLKEEFEGMVSG